MNEQIYLAWSKFQLYADELNSLISKLDSLYIEMADHTADLSDLVLKDSDSETISEAAVKYEALIKLLKNGSEAGN